MGMFSDLLGRGEQDQAPAAPVLTDSPALDAPTLTEKKAGLFSDLTARIHPSREKVEINPLFRDQTEAELDSQLRRRVKNPLNAPLPAPLPEGVFKNLGAGIDRTLGAPVAATAGLMEGVGRAIDLTQSINRLPPFDAATKYTGVQKATELAQRYNNAVTDAVMTRVTENWTPGEKNAFSDNMKRLRQTFADQRELGNMDSLGKLRSGDFAGGFSDLGAEALQQIPIISSIFVAGPSAALPMIGAASAGQRKGELQDDQGMSETAKTLNAVAQGFLEAATERINTIPMVGKIMANEATRRVAVKSMRDGMAHVLKGILGSSWNEGAEEFANAIGGGLVDMATKAPDAPKSFTELLSQAARAFYGGAIVGGPMGAVAGAREVQLPERGPAQNQPQAAPPVLTRPPQSAPATIGEPLPLRPPETPVGAGGVLRLPEDAAPAPEIAEVLPTVPPEPESESPASESITRAPFAELPPAVLSPVPAGTIPAADGAPSLPLAEPPSTGQVPGGAQAAGAGEAINPIPPGQPIPPSRVINSYNKHAPDMAGGVVAKNADTMLRAINTGEWTDLLAKQNRASRAVFAEITGVKLPASEKMARAYVAMVAKAYRNVIREPPTPSPSTPAEKENGVRPGTPAITAGGTVEQGSRPAGVGESSPKTFDQLKAEAKARGVDTKGAMNRKDLMARMEKASPSAKPAPDGEPVVSYSNGKRTVSPALPPGRITSPTPAVENAAASAGKGNPKQLRVQKEFLRETLEKMLKDAPDAEPRDNAPKEILDALEAAEKTYDQAKIGAARKAFVESRTDLIEINVPDDGNFKVANNKPAISALMKRLNAGFVNPETFRGADTISGYLGPSAVAKMAIPAVPAKPITDFVKINAIVENFVAEDETASRPGLTQVHFNPKLKELVATNGRSLLVVQKPKGSPKGWESAAPAKEYPETYRSAVPADEANSHTVDAAEAYQKIMLASRVTDDSFPSIHVYIGTDGEIATSANSPSVGEYQSDNATGGRWIGAFNPKYLGEMFSAMMRLGADKVTLNWRDESAPFKFMGNNGVNATGVIMPMKGDGQPLEVPKPAPATQAIEEPAPSAEPPAKVAESAAPSPEAASLSQAAAALTDAAKAIREAVKPVESTAPKPSPEASAAPARSISDRNQPVSPSGRTGSGDVAKSKPNTSPKLRYIRTVRVDESARKSADGRFRVDTHIAEYRDEQGNEFRKSFEVKRGEAPDIPKSGTSAEINAVQDQTGKASPQYRPRELTDLSPEEILLEARAILKSGKLYPLQKSLLKSAIEKAESGDFSQLAMRVDKSKSAIAEQDEKNKSANAEEDKSARHLASVYGTVEAVQKQIDKLKKERTAYTSTKRGKIGSFGGTYDPAGGLTRSIERLERAIEMLKEGKLNSPQFRPDTGTRSPSAALAALRTAIPGATVTADESNRAAVVKLPNGKTFFVNIEDSITIPEADRESVRQAHGVTASKADGYWLEKDAVMALAGDAPQIAIDHEVFHMARSLAQLRQGEQDALTLRFGHGDAAEEKMAEAYAKFVAARAPAATMWQRSFAKIQDFFRKIAEALGYTGTGTAFESVRSGRAYRGEGGTGIAGRRFAATNRHRADVAPPDELGFYSQVERTAQAAPQDKMHGEQWNGWLSRQPGVKKEELDWIGLQQWLAEQKGAVTKSAVLDFIRANNVQVREVQLGGVAKDSVDDMRERLKAIRAQYYAGEISREERDRLLDENQFPEKNNPTKFSQYQLPGGENYRELLLTMPAVTEDIAGYSVIMEENHPPSGAFSIVHNGMVVSRGYATREAADTESSRLAVVRGGGAAGKPAFMSSHFSEPNILAHVRFNERTDADGKRVLFIEEVQSDWHQAGREKGYTDGPADLVARRKDNSAQYDIFNSKGERVGGVPVASSPEQAIRLWNSQAGLQNRVPNAPFKTSWPMLAMKRMIRYAAENGFDKVAWTTGEQQAERYDLSKQISEVSITDNSSGGVGIPKMDGAFSGGNLLARDHSGRVVLDKYVSSPEELPSIIGKDASEKLLNATPKAERISGIGVRQRKISGVDLKIGGEGMKGFYDAILPSEINKYVKRWGGKVEKGWITDKGYMTELDGTRKPISGEESAVHSLAITPAMRESVMQGQPRFRPITPAEDAAAWKQSLNDTAKSLFTTFTSRPKIEGRKDFTWAQTYLSQLLHIAKIVPAMERAFGIANTLEDKKTEFKHQVIEYDKETERTLLHIPDELRRNDKKAYDAYAKYYYTKDQERNGYRVVRNPAGGFDLLAPSAEYGVFSSRAFAQHDIDTHQQERPGVTMEVREIAKGLFTVADKARVIDHFDTDADAWTGPNGAFEREAKDMRAQGIPDNAIAAVMAMRKTLHNSYLIQSKKFRDSIEAAINSKQPMPTEVVRTDDGASVTIDLSVAMSRMGDLRGSYMPRMRPPGAIKVHGINRLTGEQKMEFRDSQKLAQFLGEQWKKEGFAVTIENSKTPAESVYHAAGTLFAQKTLLQEALNRAIHSGDWTAGLKELGWKAEWGTDKAGKRELVMTKPGLTVQEREAIKALGGRWYDENRPSQISIMRDLYGEEVDTATPERQEEMRAEAKKRQDEYDEANSEAKSWHFVDPETTGKELEKKLFNELGAVMDGLSGTGDIALDFSRELVRSFSDLWKSRGSRSHMISRNTATGAGVVEGYEKDPTLAIATLTSAVAGGAAKHEVLSAMLKAAQGTDISFQEWKSDYAEAGQPKTWANYREFVDERRIHPTEQKNAYKFFTSLYDDMARNSERIDRLMGWLKAGASLKYLSFRLPSALINGTTLITSAPPVISKLAGVGIMNAQGEVATAVKDYGAYLVNKAKGHFGLAGSYNGKRAALIHDIIARGWHEPRMIDQMTEIMQSRWTGAWRKVMKWGMAAFAVTESMNRVATIMAGYSALEKKAKRDGVPFDRESAMLKAKEISDLANGNYNKANKPLLTQGGDLGAQALGSAYTFKNYMHNYVLTMNDLGFTSKQAAWMGLSGAAIGGLAASPVLALAFAAAGLFRDEDPKEEFFNWLESLAGDKAERLARQGVAGAVGVDVSGSMGMSMNMPTNLMEILGAPGAVLQDIGEGIDAMRSGNVGKGMEKALPSAISNILRGRREATQGVTTESGKPVFHEGKPLKADWMEAIARALSFNPARLSEAQKENWNERKMAAKFAEQRAEIYLAYRQFFMQPPEKRKQADLVDIINDAKEYNMRAKASRFMPSLITPASMRQAVRAKPSKMQQVQARDGR